jgi:hypothetical protein
MSPEPEVSGKSDRLKPELGGEVLSVNMNVGQLIRFMAVEVESIGSGPKNGRH